ncbi:5364_t:CDS:2, partial [Racocetra persica]
LNLNSFVNLEELCISGNNASYKQKLTSLKIDKCNKLTTLTINHTTLDSLNVRENATLQNITLTNNQLDDNILKSQVKRLINEIRNVKNTSIGDLKLEAKKIEEENLEYQLAVIKDKLEYQVAYAKDKLNKENQSLLEILLETQQEVLQSGNSFARNILEKVKKQLSN